MYADENVIKIKHAVLREVAKLAFEGTLDAQRDHIAVRLIPGPTPQFRCCIYKEREIAQLVVPAKCPLYENRQTGQPAKASQRAYCSAHQC